MTTNRSNDSPHSGSGSQSSEGYPAQFQDKMRLDGTIRLTDDGLGDRGQSTSAGVRAFLRGPWLLILGFGIIISFGSILLKLPWSSASMDPITWGEAIFTATSATTVTGLVVRSTATDFSLFGQVIILLLLQLGGVGFISFSVLLFRLIGRRVTLQTRFAVQQDVGADELGEAVRLARYVLAVTLTLELVGALLLWLRWRTVLPEGQALWYAIFHSISSYCNAGFDLFSGTQYNTFFGFGTDYYTLLVSGLLILIGGFGITILYDIWESRSVLGWALNTKLTLALTIILTSVGTTIVLFDSNLHYSILPDQNWTSRMAVALYTVVSARTAGLTILPVYQLNEGTQLIILFWMFIGGAPASMAGGVSTSTVAVLFVAVLATARGRTQAVSFHKTIPEETISKAVAIMTVSTLLVAVLTIMLSLRQAGSVFPIGFEVVSAFSNAGYSLSYTGELDSFGRFVIAFAMFWGRLGPLTIVVALAQREQPALVRYPDEAIILG